MSVAAIMSWAVASAAPAAASAPPLTQQLQQLVNTPGYRANINRLFASLPVDVFQRCPALASPGSQVTVLTPVSFAPDGYPVSGTWRQSFPISGCGNDTTINIFFSGQPDEKITSLIAAPGDTHADPVLQRDAMRYVGLAARAVAPTCTTPHVRHTRYEGVTTPRTKAWHERWIIAACGRDFSVPLTFTPDETGTRITAEIPKSGG